MRDLPTLRAFVARDGRALLRPGPARPVWLHALLADLAGCEIRVTIAVVGTGRPDWLQPPVLPPTGRTRRLRAHTGPADGGAPRALGAGEAG